MIYDYLVTLKNERRKYIDKISQGLLGLSAIFFLTQLSSPLKYTYLLWVSFIVIIAGLVMNWFSAIKKRKPVNYSRLLFVAGITWFAMPFLPWAGIPLILLGLLEKQAKFPMEIGFTEDRIVFNTLIEKKYSWLDFNNIILKDNILTLDFKNNKLFQKETIDEDGDVEEDEFNEYCRRQLERAAKINGSMSLT